MNLLNIAKMGMSKGTIISRLERIKREGSPPYSYNMPATAAGANQIIDPNVTFPESRKYSPLDYIEIVNNEAANNLQLIINGKDTYYIPAGAVRTIHGKGVALHHLKIVNEGAAATTLGLVRVTLQKEAYTIDKWASDR